MEQMQSGQEIAAMAEKLALMEETVAALERRLAPGSGEVERMIATVEAGETVSLAQVEAMESRLAATERQLAVLQAAAAQSGTQSGAQQLRRTITASASSLLAKHGIGEAGPVEASALDAALVSLPVEQRIAVKSQLLRAGLLA